MTSKSGTWSLVAGALLLLALTWILSPRVVQSQERRPVFDVSECIPTQGGYVDNGHSAVPGAIVCKYHKPPAGNPDAENYKSLWLVYRSTPEEALAELRDSFLTDDHVKKFLCATWDDCDKIERGLLERSENSLYGYANTLTNDPVHYSLERRFVDGSYTATIFVQGEVFASLDEAKAEVAELEQLARALVAAPRDWIALVDRGSTGTPGAAAEAPSDPNEGKSCSDYCKELDPPSSQYVSGETYPDCDCACWTGKIYFDGECVSCDWLCTDDDMYPITPHFQECSCLCKDPAMTWDRASGECVPGEDRTGMACSEYCDLVDPGVGWMAPGSGETYPDCDCWCDPSGGGATYINGLCVPCQSACRGDDVFLLQPIDGPCRCLCRDNTKVWDQATGQCLPAEDKTGMPCTEYCAQLEPGGGVPLASSGQTYPDCQCQCGEDKWREYAFFQNQCVPCSEMCRDQGISVFPRKDGECICVCDDPLWKWDQASGACVPLDGSECFTGNGCQTENGENCANCSDCTCDIVSVVDASLRLSKVCQPDHPLADNRGCVVAEESMTPQEQLETQEAQWRECRDAWALMNLSALSVFKGDAQVVMSAMASLPQVAHWQRQCSCVPESGVVVGNEAKDPMICLIRCCDRILDGINAQEERVKGTVPVVRGPGIKTRPADAAVEILEGQVVKIDGSLDLWGDRPNPLITTFGNGSPRSQYEIIHRPDSGMEIYLYEGAYTHTFYDEGAGAIGQVGIEPGEMLSIGPDGVPLSRSAFDVAAREQWWLEAPYRVVCPEGAHQEGADCYCDEGYLVDAARQVCVPLVAWTRPAQAEVVTETAATVQAPVPELTAESPTDSPPLVEVTVTPGGGSSAGTAATTTGLLLVIVGGLVLLVVILVAVLIVVLRRRR
jgi:hypothetical protein